MDAPSNDVARRHSLLKRAGFSSADERAFVASLMHVREQLDAIAQARSNWAVTAPGSSAALAGLKQQEDGILDSARTRVELSLSPDGGARLSSHVTQYVKRHIIIYGSAIGQWIAIEKRWPMSMTVAGEIKSLANWRTSILAMTIVFVFGTTAFGQTMSFSIYTDFSGNPQAEPMLVYSTIDGYDNSSGCGHSGYSITGWLTGPYGGVTENTSYGGMSIGITLGFEGDGDYRANSRIQYTCSCIQGTAYAGSGQILPIQSYRSLYHMTSTGNPDNTYTLDAVSGNNHLCSHATALSSDTILAGIRDVGLLLGYTSNPAACTGVCRRNAEGTAKGPTGPVRPEAANCGGGLQ
jgi:hypothetical protein